MSNNLLVLNQLTNTTKSTVITGRKNVEKSENAKLAEERANSS